MLSRLALAACLGATGLVGISACESRVTPVPAPSAAEDGCARIVSAIGFVDPFLPTATAVPTAPLDEGLRGHLAYVEGTVVRFEDSVPAQAAGAAEELRAAAADLTAASVPLPQVPERLSRYRAAVSAAQEACAS